MGSRVARLLAAAVLVTAPVALGAPERGPAAARPGAQAAPPLADRAAPDAGVSATPSPAPSGPRVVSVRLEVRGRPDVPVELAPLLALAPGEPLSLRGVRRSIERLFSTGRFSDAVARTEDVEGGVLLTFELVPIVRIARIEVSGARALSRDDVLAAARLAEGAEYWPERVEEARAAIAAAYARRGFYAARVEATGDPLPGGDLRLRIVVDEGAPTRVTSLVFEGSPGLPEQRLASAFGLRVGDVLDRTRLDPGAEALRQLYRDTAHARARVGAPRVERSGETARVVVPVEAGPRFVLRIAGNRRFGDRTLRGVLGIDPAETLDRAAEEKAARRLEAFYRFRGFPDVRVEPREEVSPDARAAVVTFHVAEGPEARVIRVLFEGRVGLPEQDLRAVVAGVVRARAPEPGEVRLTRDPLERDAFVERAPDAPDPAPLEVFVEDAWREAADAMQRLYRDQGWTAAKVALERVDDDVPARTTVVRYRIEEGVRTLVAGVRFEGLPAGVPPPELPALLPGAPYSAARLDDARGITSRWLGRRSYLFARVDADPGLSADGREARPVLRIDAGPAVRVGQVVIRGLQRTDERLVRANLHLSPGEQLDPESLFDSQRELLLLGLFRTVSVRLIAPDTPEPAKDVVVELRERPRLSGSIGAGYSLEDGPRLIGDLAYPNVLGQGINFTLRGKVNYVGASFQPTQDFVDSASLQGLQGIDFILNAGLSEPRIYQLLPARVGARINLVAERVHRPTYFFSRVSTPVGVDWSVTRWLQLTGNYLLENVLVRAQSGVGELLTPNRTDAERLRFPTGNYFLQTLGAGVTLDFRDDPANPRLGLLVSTLGEITKDIHAETTDVTGANAVPARIFTAKVQGTVSGYLPLAPRTVLALSVRGGKIFALEPDSQIIQPKRFFLGGATSLRGFREDSVIPQDVRNEYAAERGRCGGTLFSGGCTPRALALIGGSSLPSEGGTLFELARAELRFPAFGAFDLGVFGEAGNLWFSSRNWRPFDLRPVAGAGIRYVTPVGPLALDVGFNLDPDTRLNEPIFAVQFSVGLF